MTGNHERKSERLLRSAKLAVALAAVVFGVPAFAQSSSDTNEGLRVTTNSAAGTMETHWWGRSGRTYFLQFSSDLIAWHYLPDISTGADAVIVYGMPLSGDRKFVRVQYTNQTSADPDNADFDGDRVTNKAELLQDTDPLSAADRDGDGIPDDWEKANFLSTLYDGSLDSDGDGISDHDEWLAHTDPHDPNNGSTPQPIPPLGSTTPVAVPGQGAVPPQWIVQFLPAGYTPVLASQAGVAVIRSDTGLYRWKQGQMLAIGGPEHGAWINDHGTVATTVRSSYGSRDDKTILGVSLSRVAVYPVDSTSGWLHMPRIVGGSKYYEWYDQTAVTIESTASPQIIDETGRLWYDGTYAYTDGLVFGLYALPYGGSAQLSRYINRYGATVSRKGLVAGSLVSTNGNSSSWVGDQPVTFEPYHVNDNGVVLGTRDVDALVWFPDGHEEPQPTDGGYVSWLDSLNRPNGTYGGQSVVWEKQEPAPGVAAASITYTRVPYIPFPLPTGWTSSHTIAPGNFSAQIGEATNASGVTHPFIAVAVADSLAVDANRDETIDPTSAGDATRSDSPYGLLANNDDDNGDSASDATDSVVNGQNDLKDFFPVYLNIKSFLSLFTPSGSIKYRLRQADGAVNFVCTNLTQSNAFSFRDGSLATGFGATLGQAASSAAVIQVPTEGVELPSQFVNLMLSQEGGVILIEGRSASNSPLMLDVFENDGPRAMISLPLVVVPAVESLWETDHADNRAPSPKPASVYKNPPPPSSSPKADKNWLFVAAEPESGRAEIDVRLRGVPTGSSPVLCGLMNSRGVLLPSFATFGSNGTASLSVAPDLAYPSWDEGNIYTLVAGGDTNGDGALGVGEYAAFGFRVVVVLGSEVGNQETILAALAELADLPLLPGLPLPNPEYRPCAAGFLRCFVGSSSSIRGVDPVGTEPLLVTETDVTHVAGVHYASGIANIPVYLFLPDSDYANMVLATADNLPILAPNGDQMAEGHGLGEVLATRWKTAKAEIQSYFQAHPDETTHTFGPYTSPVETLRFAGARSGPNATENDDSFLTFGDARLTPTVISFVVERDATAPNTVHATSITVGGTLVDFYDFDFTRGVGGGGAFGGLSRKAATVEIGWEMPNRSGGMIFKSKTMINHTFTETSTVVQGFQATMPVSIP